MEAGSSGNNAKKRESYYMQSAFRSFLIRLLGLWTNKQARQTCLYKFINTLFVPGQLQTIQQCSTKTPIDYNLTYSTYG